MSARALCQPPYALGLVCFTVPTKISVAVGVVSNAIGGIGIVLCVLTIGAIWVFQ